MVVWRVALPGGPVAGKPMAVWRTHELMADSLDRPMAVCHVVYDIVQDLVFDSILYPSRNHRDAHGRRLYKPAWRSP
jgi:hypothetical protein